MLASRLTSSLPMSLSANTKYAQIFLSSNNVTVIWSCITVAQVQKVPCYESKFKDPMSFWYFGGMSPEDFLIPSHPLKFSHVMADKRSDSSSVSLRKLTQRFILEMLAILCPLLPDFSNKFPRFLKAGDRGTSVFLHKQNSLSDTEESLAHLYRLCYMTFHFYF